MAIIIIPPAGGGGGTPSGNYGNNLQVSGALLNLRNDGTVLSTVTLPTSGTETDPLSIHLDQTSPQTMSGGAFAGSGLVKLTGGQLGVDTTTYATAAQLSAYQPSGNYATTAQLSAYQPSGNYATVAQLSAYQPSGDYATVSQLSAYQPSGNYATVSQLSAYQPSGNYATVAQLSAYQPSGNYLTNITTSTPTNLTGLLKGNGADIDQATAEVDYLLYESAGILVKPTITVNSNGTLTLGSGDYLTYTDNAFSRPLVKTTVAGATYSFTDNASNYLIFDGNDKTIKVLSSRATIDQSIIIPILTVYREGTTLHVLDWDNLAKGLGNKISDRLVRIQRFAIEPGDLALSQAPTRKIAIASGYVWHGAVRQYQNAIDSSANLAELWVNTNGTWTKQTITQFDNTQYNDPVTGLQTLSNTNRYAVNWVWRCSGSTGDHMYVVLGTGDYTERQALDSQIPSLPLVIQTNGVFVGRIIVQKSIDVAAYVDSASSTAFTSAGAEVDPLSVHLDQTSPQTMTGGQFSGTGHITVTNGLLGVDTTTYQPSGSYVLTSTTVNGQQLSGNITISAMPNQNGGNALKFWSGTAAQYAAIGTKDPDTLYFIS